MNRIFQWISHNIKRLVAEHNQSKAATTAGKETHTASQKSSSKLTVAETPLKSLSNYATLDTLVTVVDALNIFEILSSIETLADENNSAQMLGNSGAVDDGKRRQHALIAAVKLLSIESPAMGVKKMVAAIKEQNPELGTVSAKQVREAVAELKEA